jgi:hypothetical protein
MVERGYKIVEAKNEAWSKIDIKQLKYATSCLIITFNAISMLIVYFFVSTFAYGTEIIQSHHEHKLI